MYKPDTGSPEESNRDQRLMCCVVTERVEGPPKLPQQRKDKLTQVVRTYFKTVLVTFESHRAERPAEGAIGT